MRTPFDPLQFLEYEMHLDLSLNPEGQIKVIGMWALPPHQQKKAKAILKTYGKLLRLQLEAPSSPMRPSVRKLLTLSD